MKKHILDSTAAALTLLVSLTAATNATAQGIVDNTGNSQNGYSIASYDTTFGLNVTYLAQSFTTGGDATSLSTIMPDLASSSGGGFQLALYSDNAGTVGTQIAVLNGSSSPGTGLQTYTASSPIALDASTAYWWVATVSSQGQFGMAQTSDPSFLTTDGWSINNGHSYNTGSSWNPTGNALLFSVGATLTPTPEPSSLALTALGLGAGAVFFRRRQVR